MEIRVYKVIDGQKYEYGTYDVTIESELKAMVSAISFLSRNEVIVTAEVIG